MLRAASDAVGAVQHRGPIQQQQRIEAQNWFADNSTSILIQQLPVFFCESREYAQRVTELHMAELNEATNIQIVPFIQIGKVSKIPLPGMQRFCQMAIMR